VEFKKGYLKTGDVKYEVIDVPGVYSLETGSRADEVALSMLEQGDIIVNVIDSTNLERNLGLTVHLLRLGKPMLIVLNFWDETKHTGITIDPVKLEHLLGVPVIPSCAVTGEGISEMVRRLPEARAAAFDCSSKDKWLAIGGIVDAVQKVVHRHHTFLERLSDFTIKPASGAPFALVVLVSVFLLVRFIGEGMINWILDPAFNRFYYPYVISFISSINWPPLSNLLLGATPEVMKSFGLLTTGIYVPFVVVLPYILAFYLILGFVEDFGYLPRLAVLLDTIFHPLGLHGYSSIPVLLGLGGKGPAILSTRILESKRERTIATVLILMSAPCMPQTAMLFSLGIKYGMGLTVMLFVILLAVAISTSFLLNKLLKGDAPELFLEIPPYRIPHIMVSLKKLWYRIKDFIFEAVPMIMLGILIINVFEIIGITGFLAEKFGAPIVNLLGLPGEIAPALLLGFLRKDVSIAMLAPFALSAKQFLVAGVFMTLYLPCIASFFVLVKESGLATALKITGLVFLSAFFTASLLNIVL
jgi:ferrous iron transport protein B